MLDRDSLQGKLSFAKVIENAIVNFGSDIGGNNNKREGSYEREGVDESFEKQKETVKTEEQE